MIEAYVSNYFLISGLLFLFGVVWHLGLNFFTLEADWSLSAFISKGMTSGSSAIIPPFIFSFWDKAVLLKIDGVQYYLGISALVLFYFFIESLIPKHLRVRKSVKSSSDRENSN